MKQLTAAILILTALTGCYPKTCPCTGGACNTSTTATTNTAPAK